MKIGSFIAAVAALTLSTLALTAGEAFATKIVPIQGKYSKIKLDGICAANGGSSYGTADTAYGCSKGNVTVECNKDGSCTGYVWLRATSVGNHVSTPEAFLQQSRAPIKREAGTITGGALSAE